MYNEQSLDVIQEELNTNLPYLLQYFSNFRYPLIDLLSDISFILPQLNL